MESLHLKVSSGSNQKKNFYIREKKDQTFKLLGVLRLSWSCRKTNWWQINGIVKIPGSKWDPFLQDSDGGPVYHFGRLGSRNIALWFSHAEKGNKRESIVLFSIIFPKMWSIRFYIIAHVQRSLCSHSPLVLVSVGMNEPFIKTKQIFSVRIRELTTRFLWLHVSVSLLM